MSSLRQVLEMQASPLVLSLAKGKRKSNCLFYRLHFSLLIVIISFIVINFVKKFNNGLLMIHSLLLKPAVDLKRPHKSVDHVVSDTAALKF
jgi:hypothetical protein